VAVPRRSRALELPFEAGLPPGAPSGLSYHPEVLSLAEESELVARLEALPFQEVRMHGVAARRTVVHFGWDYGYDSWKIQPTDPIPDFLQTVRSRVASLAGLPAEALAQALIARYPAGAGIGWHRDAPMFGPTVAGVSLLSECLMRLRPPGRGRRPLFLPLAARSAYVLSGAARAQWQHSIPPVERLRYSISFRTLANVE
jgi:alkylated DNA repair dioxygenase AlkB